MTSETEDLGRQLMRHPRRPNWYRMDGAQLVSADGARVRVVGDWIVSRPGGGWLIVRHEDAPATLALDVEDWATQGVLMEWLLGAGSGGAHVAGVDIDYGERDVTASFRDGPAQVVAGKGRRSGLALARAVLAAWDRLDAIEHDRSHLLVEEWCR